MMQVRHRSRVPALAACIALAVPVTPGAAVLPALPTAHAASLTVTNSSDSAPGSLRATIAGAAAGDTITFAPSLAGQTIQLSSQLTIGVNLTILGPGADQLAISGGPNVREFFIPAASAT